MDPADVHRALASQGAMSGQHQQALQTMQENSVLLKLSVEYHPQQLNHLAPPAAAAAENAVPAPAAAVAMPPHPNSDSYTCDPELSRLLPWVSALMQCFFFLALSFVHFR